MFPVWKTAIYMASFRLITKCELQLQISLYLIELFSDVYIVTIVNCISLLQWQWEYIKLKGEHEFLRNISPVNSAVRHWP